MRTSVSARRTAVAVALALSATGAVGIASPARAATNVPDPSPACTRDATQTPAVTTCDLWAKPGTLTLPAGASPASVTIWGYAATETGAASSPGPVLVAQAGDTVNLTVHNGLAEATSLSLPQVDGFVDDGVGTDAGGTKTYSFTASRPGTYLYQAGLTANGPRQAAMGLVGGLVVRPATAGTLDGNTATAYDDEALLVLTEVDDRLNANPTGFDMRSYAPRFRLINGGALSGVTGTGTTTIGTAAGNTLLLRTVNAGLTEHSLGALGLRQNVVALGGRSLAHPYDVFAETAQPGQTVDTIVSIPTGSEGTTYPLYETAAGDGVSGNLANFGGMLAFVTVAGTAATGGPAVTGLTATSNHASPLPAFPVTSGDTVTVTGTAGTGATVVEYAVDAQSGWTAATLSGSTLSATVPVTTALATGQHTVFVRAGTSDGTTTTYGAVSAVTFAVDNTGPKVTGLTVSPTTSTGSSPIAVSATGDDSTTGGSNTVAAQYRVVGPSSTTAWTPLTLNRTTNPVAALTGSIPAPGAASGVYTVEVQAKDALGNLSGTVASATFRVDGVGPLVDGTSITVTPAVNDGTKESRTGSGTFTVAATLTDDTAVASAEGFFDTGPATGSGFAMYAPSQATGTPLTVSAEVPLSQLTQLADGAHTVWVRGRDTAGNVGGASQSNAGALVVDRVAPTIGTVTLATSAAFATTATLTVPVSNPGTGITSSSWTLKNANGTTAGTGSLGTITAAAASGTLTATVPYAAKAGGTITVSVTDGVGRTVTKTQKVNRIFSSTFDSTTRFGFDASNGTVSAVTTGIAGRSASVSLTGGTAYLTDNTPAAETEFHAQFLARATGTANSTQNATVYQAYTGDNGGGTALFRVVLRHSGNAAQVGLATGNAAPAAWGTVTTTGSTPIRVDVVGTTATLTVGTTQLAGSVTLPSAAGVGSIRLGAISTGNNLGSLMVDSYDSARSTLPS